MTAASELIMLIKNAKGILKVSARGHLQLSGERIPDELFEVLQVRREELAAFLLSRKKIKAAEVSPAEPAEGFVETRRDYLRCANPDCGHWRSRHCTQRRLKPGAVLTHNIWKGLVDENNLPIPCSHTPAEGTAPYACNSNACGQIIGEGQDQRFCDCTKFVSPLRKKTARTPMKEPKLLIPRQDLERAHAQYLQQQAAQPMPKRTKEAVLLETIAEYPELANFSVKQLSELTGMSQSWVRKVLRQAGIMAPATPRNKTTITGTLVTTGQQSQN